MNKEIFNKRCVIVCGGGGVGKTTIAASLGIAAARTLQAGKNRVLVVTIDPSKRLAEAFGFTTRELIDGGEPLKLSEATKQILGLSANHELSVGILNPQFILNQVLEQTLTPAQRERLIHTALFTHLSSMMYGLQEYTAYEWVTRMIKNNEYDFIVLDTPPAAHAKDFFMVPERIQNLMESSVFKLFSPKKSSWLSQILSFSWVESLLGEKIYRESQVFFEMFASVRDRVLERCRWLSQFFTQKEVSIIAVSTVESSGQFELQGLISFLKTKNIPLEGIILNQIEMPPDSHDPLEKRFPNLDMTLISKLARLEDHQRKKSENANQMIERTRKNYPEANLITVPMIYSNDGFEILRANSEQFSD